MPADQQSNVFSTSLHGVKLGINIRHDAVQGHGNPTMQFWNPFSERVRQDP
jgi:hypothetical protein